MTTFLDEQFANNKQQKIIAEAKNDIIKLICKWQTSGSIQNDFSVINSSYVDEDLLFTQIKEFQFFVFVSTKMDHFLLQSRFYTWFIHNVNHFTDKILNGKIIHYDFIDHGIKLFLDKNAIEIDLIFVAMGNEKIGSAVVRA